MNNLKKIQFKIMGMDCAGCANTIEQYCKKINGVDDAQVNYSLAILSVTFLNDKAQSTLIEGLKKLGYLVKIIYNTNNSLHKIKLKIETRYKKIYRFPQVNNYKNRNLNEFNYEKVAIFSLKTVIEKLNFNSIYFTLILFILYIPLFFLSHFSFYILNNVFSILAVILLIPLLKKVIIFFKVGFYFSVEFLMSVAIISAIFIHAAQEAYIVLILFRLGENLERYTAGKASSGIQNILKLLPDNSKLVLNDNSIMEIKSSEIKKNQILLINPSERFPADGVIISGESDVDESLLTGESNPVLKKVNARIFAGSLNLTSSLKIRTTDVGQNHTVSKFVNLVQSAQGSKSNSFRLIEKFSQVYTPWVLVIGIVTALFPPLFGLTSWNHSIYMGLSILLIGCPCALIISIPSAISAGISVASKFGILVKNATAIEILGKIRTIAFDKTGTLTEGNLKVTDVISISKDFNTQKIFEIVFSLSQNSTHPIAHSILNYGQVANIQSLSVQDNLTKAGIGLFGKIDEINYSFTSVTYAKNNYNFPIDKFEYLENYLLQGKNISILSRQNDFNEFVCIGFIALSDTLKQNIKLTIDTLKNMNILPFMLTGDHKFNAKLVLNYLNINGKWECLPEDKLNFIQENSKSSSIAMVGDGLNDAPALTAADVGIVLGNGVNIAVDSAQIIITNPDSYSLIRAILISRKTLNLITQNIVIALLLKGLFLVFTFLGDTRLWMAILADTGATVLVTLNSIRLLRYRP